ncbi:MAG: DUF3800 domain-containing protein [candidate division WOR-3 bacterium]|nr:MAG: DUF3800 domain-containing protein [candidate division WOR-3 bacterium]
MAEKEYIIFCDESAKEGKYYCNFYGGALVGGSQHKAVSGRLAALKDGLHLYGEVKWEKVTEQYLEKYNALVTAFFKEVSAGRVKVRIMFRQKAQRPRGLSKDDLELQYLKLYYQFIKWAFGLHLIPRRKGGSRLRLYFDRIPDTREKVAQFKAFLLSLQKSTQFRQAGISIAPEDITEIRSSDHVLAQCVDVVLGAMQFRLNDWHKQKLPGQRVRGKRTRAKEKLYKAMLEDIRKLLPGFNIGTTTGRRGDERARWNQPYRHWCFHPKDTVFDASLAKPRGGR